MFSIFPNLKVFRKNLVFVFLCCLPSLLILSVLVLRTPLFVQSDEKRWFDMALSILSFKYECNGRVCTWHPPMYPASINLFFVLFGIGILQARFTTVFYTLLFLVLTYFFAKEIFGHEEKSKALLAVLLLGTVPGILLFGFMIYSNIAEAFFISTSLFYFLRGVNTKKGRYLLLFGVFLSLGVATKLTTFQALAYVLLFIILTKSFDILKNKWFITGFFLIFLTLALWLTWIALNGLMSGYVTFWLHRGSVLAGKTSEGVLANTPVRLYALMKVSPFAYIIWIPMLTGIGTTILTLFGVYFSLKNRQLLSKGNILLLIWVLVFLVVFSSFGNRAARFTLPILIPLILFAIKGLDVLRLKLNKKIIILILSLILLTNLIQFVFILPYLLVYR